jgi:antitoxin PrlF
MVGNAAMNKIVSKISSKSQTVIPREVREKLGVGPGDRLLYRYTAEGVVIEKIDEDLPENPFEAFWEWGTPEDDEAFKDL